MAPVHLRVCVDVCVCVFLFSLVGVSKNGPFLESPYTKDHSIL